MSQAPADLRAASAHGTRAHPLERVAHLIAPAPAGGAESVVLALCGSAPDQSWVIVLNQEAAADDPPHPFSVQMNKRRIAGEEIRRGRRRYLEEMRAVVDILRRERVAVLHTHGYHAAIVGLFAARRAGIPVVATVHGYLSRNVKERLYNVVDRLALRRFDGIIAVSQGIAEQLIASGVRRDRITVVQNGLGTPVAALPRAAARERLGLAPHGKMAGWVGRLSIEKGADLFIEAMELTGDDVQATIIGDGAELAPVQRQAVAAGIAHRVRFAGFRADASELLRAFDILVLSSRTEGTPMIILEAVAADIPIVAFAVGGIPDVLSPQTAWLVPPGDVNGLANAMGAALDAPDERVGRARAARDALRDRLSAERWLERVWAAYGRAADHAARR